MGPEEKVESEAKTRKAGKHMSYDPRKGWAESFEKFVKEIMGVQTKMLEIQAHLVLQAQDVPGEHEAAGDESYEEVEKRLREVTKLYRSAREHFLTAKCDWEKIEGMGPGAFEGPLDEDENEEE